jgi:Peptidase M50B-like
VTDPVRGPDAPPRWTFPVCGPRLRVSVGLVVSLAVVTAALTVGPLGSPRPEQVLAGLVGVIAAMLIHEGGHAAAAVVLGYRVEWVVLGGIAGVTAYRGRDDRPIDRLAVALAGPAANAFAALMLAWAADLLIGGAQDAVALAAVLNAVGLVVNLVPLRGSDGAAAIQALRDHRAR